jgi:hypothetical protein
MRESNDLRTRLAEADPLQREPALPDADTARMRRVILETPPAAEIERAFWPGALAVAGALALAIAGGIFIGDGNTSTPPESAATVQTPVDAGERRQVQFATPGGTRIIWTLDPEFKMPEVVP